MVRDAEGRPSSRHPARREVKLSDNAGGIQVVPGATAAQYAWIDDWLGEVSGAYCLTLAHGLTPQDFLARIGALPEASPRTGLGPLAEASWQIWDRHQGEKLLIGVTAVPEADGRTA
jgi:hypothetical protein